MTVKQGVTIFILVCIAGFLGFEFFTMMSQLSHLRTAHDDLSQRLQASVLENKKLQEEIRFYSNPETMEQLLREKFNYKKPGETMIIVVPSDQKHE